MLLRRHGIAARYVSGYLFGAARGRRQPTRVEVQTHAWLEALLPGARRRAASRSGSAPTRRTAGWPARRHVKIGHGRRYADVPPIKGVYRGAAGADLDAARDDDAGWTRRPAPRA